MIATNQAYKNIVAGRHGFEWKIAIDNAEFGSSYIVGGSSGDAMAPRLIRQMFPSGEPSVGNCMSAEFIVTLLLPSSAIPRYSIIRPYFRAVAADGSYSDWYQAGTFFIDSRRYNPTTGTTTLTCYDAMLKADGAGGNTYYDLTSITSWPASASAVVAEIADIINVDVDSRTSIQSGFTVGDPGDYTMREVLGFIAAAHAGNWCITNSGKLRLVPIIGDDTDTISLELSIEDAEISRPFPVWSRAVLKVDSKTKYVSGGSYGINLYADDPWGTQAKADYMASVIDGFSYYPYEIKNAFIDPAAELGDKLTFRDRSNSNIISSRLWNFDLLCDDMAPSTAMATGGDELKQEYPYIPIAKRRARRTEEQLEEVKEEIEEGIPEEIEEAISQVFLKVSELDFSGWATGYFSETLDNDQVNGFLVDFDGSGMPIRITDGVGHETEVIW